MNEMTREELLQKAKPILFNTEMVRATLDGRKCVTRRCIRPRYKEDEGGFCVCTRIATGERWVEKMDWDEGTIFPDGNTRHVNSPYHPGDILYVRETWRPAEIKCDGGAEFFYFADGFSDASNKPEVGRRKWRPSIHMPKEAARIFLRVRNVRVERLQDMTAEDCKKEGGETDRYLDMQEEAGICGIQCETLKDYFAYSIWDSVVPKQELNKYGWDANPWVWVIEFERLEVD